MDLSKKGIHTMEDEERINNYEILTDEFNTEYLRYKLKMDWKAFKKFSWVQQQLLCEKKDIILLNHETKGERYRKLTKGLIGGMTLKNINKGIDKFNAGVDQFMNLVEPSKDQKDLSLPNYKEMSELLGSQKNQTFNLHNAKALKKLLGR